MTAKLRIARRLTLAMMMAALAACTVSSPPIEKTSQVVATPVQGEMSVGLSKSRTVGEVVPVQVSIANGTDITRAVVPSQVFAINQSGERIAPLPPGEAARQAGSARELKAALSSAAVSGAAAGAVGAGLGAAVGAVSGGIGPGAIIGAAIGAGTGVFRGAERGQDRADSQATQQLEALSLHPEEVAHNFTVSGYVFYPKGNYNEVQVLMINRETGDTEVVTRPWP